jgi:uncharacterized membrane protein
MFYNGTLGLHSLLRWGIILLLLVNISRNFLEDDKTYTKSDRSWNLRLVIITHLNLLIGLYQYFFGPKGMALVKMYGMADVMKNSVQRFWVVEHIAGMLIAVVLITITSSISKKPSDDDAAKHKKLMWFYIAALVVIIASVPWPFRFNDVPWVRSLY